MLKESRMKDMNYFFDHELNETWHNNFTNTNYAQDHFLTRPASKKIQITNVLACKEGRQSDHLPIRILIKTKGKKQKLNKVRTNWKTRPRPKKQQHRLTEKSKCPQSVPLQMRGNNHKTPDHEQFATEIVRATNDVAAKEVKPHSDWFEKSKETLLPIIRERNQVHFDFIHRSSDHNKARLQNAHRYLKRAKRQTKR
jgi:hypothetical protein